MRGDLDHRGATFGEMIGMSDKRVPKEYQKPAPKEDAQARKERPIASWCPRLLPGRSHGGGILLLPRERTAQQG
jgi:hypothetical protein